ncbi:unnamed protein product, partial [Iphiclides podalirius]
MFMNGGDTCRQSNCLRLKYPALFATITCRLTFMKYRKRRFSHVIASQGGSPSQFSTADDRQNLSPSDSLVEVDWFPQ